MEEQLQEDWLDVRLREEAPYIDDAGFTARVMQQLPAQSRRRSLRAFILVGATVVACLFALLLSGPFLLNSALWLVATPLVTVLAIAGICGAAVTALGTTAAVARVRGHHL